MIRYSNIILVIGFFVAAVVLTGCGRSESYGKEISNSQITSVGNILSSPRDYKGKTVAVKGKIITECPTGCWFDLKDGNAVIYVDLNPTGIAISQSVGRDVTVEGEVKVKGGKPRIVGGGVEIK